MADPIIGQPLIKTIGAVASVYIHSTIESVAFITFVNISKSSACIQYLFWSYFFNLFKLYRSAKISEKEVHQCEGLNSDFRLTISYERDNFVLFCWKTVYIKRIIGYKAKRSSMLEFVLLHLTNGLGALFFFLFFFESLFFNADRFLQAIPSRYMR